MFNTYKTIHDYSQIAREMKLNRESEERISRLNRESNERISQNEIKSKDRVNITLEEYERIKSNISRLEHELCIAESKLGLFKEVANLNIIPDTFRVSTNRDCMERPRRMRCLISFDYEIEC